VARGDERNFEKVVDPYAKLRFTLRKSEGNPQKKMNATKLSPDVLACHNRAAYRLAESYLDALRADSDNTLRSLADLGEARRYCLSGWVYEAADARGIRRISVRRDLIVSLAHAEVLATLRKETALADKLLSIRSAQANKSLSA
jgi:hypothetical protein